MGRLNNALRWLFLAVLALGTTLGVGAPADLVVRGANVMTVDTNRPRAEGFAVTGGKFVMVGSHAAIQKFIGPKTTVLDLAGKTVVPGFIDAHAHPGPEYPEDAPWASVDCRPNKTPTMQAFIASLERVNQLGMVVVPHSYIWEHGDKREAYGEWRWKWMHAARSILDAGIPMAGHSDDPVSEANPLLRIQDLVTRTSAEGKVYGESQRISAEEALRAWTLGGAFASFDEGRLGSITVGKLADFVVLSDDPTRVKPHTIKDIAVEKTVIGGRVVWEKESSSE